MKQLALLVVLLAAAPLFAGDIPPAQAAASHYFRDLELVDQNGRTVDLFDDLMAGKIVVINSFFVTCHGACPVMSATMRKIDAAFGDSQMSLISITVDPENDTPQKLREYAERFNASERWHLLTGSKKQVSAALGKLGMAVDDRDAHVNVIVVANLRTGLWKKVLGIASAEKVLETVRGVVEDRGGPVSPQPSQR